MANSKLEEKWDNYTPHRNPAFKERMLISPASGMQRTDAWHLKNRCLTVACPLPAGERVLYKLNHWHLKNRYLKNGGGGAATAERGARELACKVRMLKVITNV